MFCLSFNVDDDELEEEIDWEDEVDEGRATKKGIKHIDEEFGLPDAPPAYQYEQNQAGPSSSTNPFLGGYRLLYVFECV
jgi:hypothetical protein